MDTKWIEFQLEHKLDKKILSPKNIFAFVNRINSQHKGICVDVKKNKDGQLTFPIDQTSFFRAEALKEGYLLKLLQK